MSLFGKTMTVFIFLVSMLFLSFSVMVYSTHVNWRARGENLKAELDQTKKDVLSLRQEKVRIEEAIKHERMALQGALIALELRNVQIEEALALQVKTVESLQADRLERMSELTTLEKELKQLVADVAQLQDDIEKTKLTSAKEFESTVELAGKMHEAVGMHRRLGERYEQLRQQVERIKAGLPAAPPSTASAP